MRKARHIVEKNGLVSCSKSVTRPLFLRFFIFFLLISLLIQAFTFTPVSKEPIPPIPPAEKLLGQFGLWESEYWSDNGVLAFQYVGDPIPGPKSPEGHILQADFTISKTTLLTAIASVHMNPDVNAIHKENISPGNLSLVDDVGNYYGPFPAEVTSAIDQNNQASATVLWVASVDHVELPPGHYLVIEWETTSTLRNEQTQGVPATFVKGVDAEAYANYMDALIAANEPEPIGQPAPEKVTYSKPLSLVNTPPDPNLSSFPANNPSYPCTFVITEPVMVTKVIDYHINNGKGDIPATIGLQEQGGTWYSSWPAYGQAYNGIPNAKWVVTPNFEIPAGSYTVKDANVTTQSADENGRALCEAKASPVITSPVNNVTGKYLVVFNDTDGNTTDLTLDLSVIDNKKTLEISSILEGQPFKFVANITERANGIVKAEYNQGFSDLRFNLLLTFKKSADKYLLTGIINVDMMGETAGVTIAGSRTSTDLPGFIPKPPSGIGKAGSIPGPATTAQAVAGIAIPTLATLIAAAAANAGSSGGNHLPSNMGGGGGTDGGTPGFGSPGGKGGLPGITSPGSPGTQGATTPDLDYSRHINKNKDVFGSQLDGSNSEDESGVVGGLINAVLWDENDGLEVEGFPDANFTKSGRPPIYDLGNKMVNFTKDDGVEVEGTPILDAPPLPREEPIGPKRGILGDTDLVQGKPMVDDVPGDSIPDQSKAAEVAGDVGIGTGTDTGVKSSGSGSTASISGTDVVQTSTATGVGTGTGTDTGGMPIPQPKPKEKPPVVGQMQGPPNLLTGVNFMKQGMNDIAADLRKQGYYPQNSLQGDPTLVFQGIEVIGKGVWNKTGGFVTGSKAITCGEYTSRTIDKVREIVNQQFPGATFTKVEFCEKSSVYASGGVMNFLDSINPDNHTFVKVTLPTPDKTEFSVDFQQGAVRNVDPMNYYDGTRAIWENYLGDEFLEVAGDFPEVNSEGE